MPDAVKWYGAELLKQISAATPEGLFDGAELLITESRGRIRSVTGNLAESGYAATSKKSTYKKDKRHNREHKPKEGQAVAAYAMFYAGFVEYGTNKQAARPFLRPTMDQLKEQLGATITLKIGKKFK